MCKTCKNCAGNVRHAPLSPEFRFLQLNLPDSRNNANGIRTITLLPFRLSVRRNIIGIYAVGVRCVKFQGFDYEYDTHTFVPGILNLLDCNNGASRISRL